MSDKPEEPDFDKLEKEMDLSPLDEDAFQMFEMFNSLLRAGFQEKQALHLVAFILVETQQAYLLMELDEEEEEEED